MSPGKFNMALSWKSMVHLPDLTGLVNAQEIYYMDSGKGRQMYLCIVVVSN